MDEQEPPRPKWRIPKKITGFVIAFVIAVSLVGGFALWKHSQPKSLLPSSVATKISGFTPYFFFEQIPNGYSLDTDKISFDQGLVIMPLAKSGSPTLVLTEQILPNNLSESLLQQEDSIKVKDTAGVAFINKVEGRVLGILTNKEHKLLLLLNAPGNTDTETITELLQALKPVK